MFAPRELGMIGMALLLVIAGVGVAAGAGTSGDATVVAAKQAGASDEVAGGLGAAALVGTTVGGASAGGPVGAAAGFKAGEVLGA